jgi:dipeptidase D
MESETKKIIDIFEALSSIPRRSKHEEKISFWLKNYASEIGLDVKADGKGNLVVNVPASPGREKAPIVVLQGHMDMVCEKTRGSSHDFTRDPIELVFDDDWITAEGTSLGADNGIALAYCLALAGDRDLVHPPLELLFTVEEETGLTGAKALSQDFINGRMLLNLDSEDEGVFTIGCAGGRDAILTLETAAEKIDKDAAGVEIALGGLAGGHSGVDIHEQRANALKLMARLLLSLINDLGAGLVSLSGGSALNAIPRDAKAIIAVKPDAVDKVGELAKSMAGVFASESGQTEEKLFIDTATVSIDGKKAYQSDAALSFLRLLRLIPSGPRDYSHTIHGLVETSSNLAVVRESDANLEILTSQRSSVDSRLNEITADIESAGILAGAAMRLENSYPGWRPDTSSPLLQRCRDVYRRMYSMEPTVEAIHAGLECGVIGSIYDGMDMISFGPTIENAHSPNERVSQSSIGKTWRFLLALLESIK